MTHDEIERVIAAHPAATTRTPWRHDDVGTTVRDLLAAHKRLARTIDAEALDALMASLVDMGEESHGRVDAADLMITHNGRRISVLSVRTTKGRTTTNSLGEWTSSARIPGLHRKGELPHDEGVHDRARTMVNDALRRLGHEPYVVAGVATHARNARDFDWTDLIVANPETPLETHLEHVDLEHRPDADVARRVREVAELIAARHEHREDVLSARAAAEEIARERCAGHDVEVVGSAFTTESWSYSREGVFKGRAYAILWVMGPALEGRRAMVGVSDEGQSIKHALSRHRANMRNADGEIACDLVLANVARAIVPRYAAELLREIEGAIAGKPLQPNEPRRRGISNVSIARGVVSAPVTLARGVRHADGALRAKSITTLPQAVMATLKGRRVRDVVDHPSLEGLVVAAATTNSQGLRMRTKRATTPIGPVLEALRAKAEEHQKDPTNGRRKKR